MKKIFHLACLLLASTMIQGAAAAFAVEAHAADDAVQPDAVNALRQMGEYLRTLKNFKLVADTVQDDVLDNGQKIQISGQTTYQVRTPDRVAAEINTDKTHRFYYYDGKSLTQYAPDLNMYSTVDAPDKIGEMIDLARKRYGLSLPIADLFYAGLDEDRIKSLTSAMLVGETMLDGQMCNHFAYRLSRVDFELWVRKEGNPLPCELLITDTTDPTRPQNGALIHIEDNANLQDSVFAFVPPKDAQKIDMEPVKGASTGTN